MRNRWQWLHWHISRIVRPRKHSVALAFERMKLSEAGAGIVEAISGTDSIRIV